MNKRFYGVLSLLLLTMAIVLGTWAIFMQSLEMALVYLFLVLVCANLIVYAFCAKCPDKGEHCIHVFPGKLAVLLPSRKQRAYLAGDYVLTITGLFTVIVFPQVWLWKNPVLFGFFWFLIIVSQLIISKKVCCECGNRNCPLCIQKAELEKLSD